VARNRPGSCLSHFGPVYMPCRSISQGSSAPLRSPQRDVEAPRLGGPGGLSAATRPVPSPPAEGPPRSLFAAAEGAAPRAWHAGAMRSTEPARSLRGPAPTARLASWRWGLALVGVTAVWGATFVMVRDAVAAIPPFTFIAYRFLAAAALLAALRPRTLLRPQPGMSAAGLVAGVALFAGYGFQTVGLQYTTASNAGFITGLAVVLTPLFAALVLRERPGLGPALGAALAFAGLALLSLQRLEVRRGDALVLGCAVAFAAHILLLGRFAPRYSSYQLAVVQLATVGVLALGWAALSGELAAPAGGQVWLALAVTAVLASAAGFLVQTRAQREVSPTKTAVILTMEPVFAGLFGFLLAGERLEPRGWAGACCILAGMLVAELGRPPTVPSRADDAFE
jgi:drug/metabolite transporter (DMT)-like permease